MIATSYNSGHTVRAYALTQMLGYASHFVCPQPLGETAARKEVMRNRRLCKPIKFSCLLSGVDKIVGFSWRETVE